MDSKKFTIVSIVIFVLSLIVFISTILILVVKPGSVGDMKKSKKKEVVENVDVGDISTQIGKSGRYYKATIVLEVVGKKGPEKVEKKMPQIKDEIIMTISYSKISDITSKEGMLALKEKLKWNINEIIGEECVSQVLFTTSILQ